jgi:serine/threonine protein kinase
VLKPLKVSPGVMALVGKVVDRRYGIRSVIGEGGMGAVYEAEHLVLGRLVALKVLHPTNAAKPEAVSRFQHEARVVSSIGHPNICELYDVGKLEDGTPFLVMERLVGDTLADRINKEGALPPEVVFDTLLQILSGLSAAHRKGIIHRDIKPENIFLARTPGSTEPIAKLLDFGISKMSALDADLHLTRTGMVMGTPYYMAPEQARGDRIDHRVDLYAIGVIFYECLTGRRPFVAPNYNALLVQILSGKPKPLRSIRPALSEAFEPIAVKAMQKQPEQRFQTAAEFHDALLRLRVEIDQESLKMEAARKLVASQPPPRPLSMPPSAEIPVHFSPSTGSGELPQALPPPSSRAPQPALPAISRDSDTDERVPFVSVSPSALAPDTYLDEGPPSFDAEPTQIETAPALLRRVTEGEADFTTPSKPLDIAEAEAIIQAAQNKARAMPLKQNPLKPAPGHLTLRPRADSRPIIPREDPVPAPRQRPKAAAPQPQPPPRAAHSPAHTPQAPATEPVAPPDTFPGAPILPAPGSLRQPPLPGDLVSGAVRRRPVPPLPFPAPAPPAPTPSPPRVAAPPQPFPSAPARRPLPVPPPPAPEEGDGDDNDPTMLYRPGRVKLPPELEKLREAAAAKRATQGTPTPPKAKR